MAVRPMQNCPEIKPHDYTMIILREGNAHDVAAIMPIMDEAFVPDYGERWSASQCLAILCIPETSLLIATYNGVMAGFALTRWVMDEEELLLIAVTKKFQKCGIGSNVIGHIVCRASENGRRHIFLEVRDNNEARKFYYRHGFEDIGRRNNYYTALNGNTIDAVTMAYKL
jgi:[ribosomal protein S18]-alanine N-acetyltransferase